MGGIPFPLNPPASKFSQMLPSLIYGALSTGGSKRAMRSPSNRSKEGTERGLVKQR